jgi:sugar phosphate isomerase/epimerase
MKLSCLPVSFFKDMMEGRLSVAEWAQLGARAGLDAIDLSTLLVPDRTAAGLARLRREIEAAGMHVAMLTSYPDFTHPDAAQRERELAEEQAVVAMAAALGAELVRVTDGQAHPETPREAGIAWAVEGLTRLVEGTRGLGVELVYENHAKPMVWQYTDFNQDTTIFLEIVRRTEHLGLGLNFDTANAAAFSPDPAALLEAVLPRVVSVHAADTAVRVALQPVLLGTGIVPFPALFRRLKQDGFAGWICIEEASRRGEEGVQAAARFVRETWDKA